MPCWLCSSSRPSSPACEPDVRIEPPHKPGVQLCLARRAASQTWRAAVPCASSRFAKPPCEPAVRAAFPNVRRRQDFAVVRSWAAVRGNILARCVLGRPSVAIFSLHASPKGPRTGKAPLPGNISPPCIQNELALARYARHVSEKPRKPPFGNAPREDLAREGPFSLHWPLESCMVRESCQGPHCTGPRILPGSPHCTDPSNHPSCADLAILWRSLPFGGEVSSLEGWEFRFLCFGGARLSVLVRRTIPPCRLGYGILELLGLRHPCLVGKPPVPSLSSAGYPAAAFSAGWRASASPASAA